MNKRVWITTVVAVLCVSTAWSAAQEAATTTNAPGEADLFLAEWLEEQAQQPLQAKAVNDGMWRQTIALLQAAARLNPREPRYPRLLAEAAMRLRDTSAAIEALKAYRKHVPDDQIAQLQLIELYATQMESADAKLNYYRQILEKPSLPPEVQSAVAVRSVPLMMERSMSQAKARLEQALRLNPVNTTALRMRYEMLEDDASASEQILAMLGMLKANPAQPQLMMAMARQIASLGLLDQALDWYARAVELYPRMQLKPHVDDVVDYAANLMIAGRSQSADAIIAAVLEYAPDDAGGHFLKVLSQQMTGDKATYAEALDAARTGMFNHWNAIYDVAAKTSTTTRPATRPSTGPTTRSAEIMGVVKQVMEQRPDFQSDLVSAASDLAWLEIYHAQKPENAEPWIKALAAILPQDSVTLARLRGWRDLVAGDKKNAERHLAAIADRDPMAALGMIRLAGADESSQKTADEQARKLQGQNPGGLVGAIIWNDLRDRRVNPTTNPSAKIVAGEVDKFPTAWLAVLDQPRNFYIVRAEPFSVVHQFVQPMFVLVTIQNIGNFDLTIGEDGLIRPDLWFDAQFRGISTDQFPGVAYDRISRAMVLHPRQSISQVVRIDQGKLTRILQQDPGRMYQIVAAVTTNPRAGSTTVIEAGPAGMRTSLNKAMTRSANPLNLPESRNKAYNMISRGSPSEKMRYLALLTIYAKGLSTTGADEKLQPMAAEFTGMVSKSRGDDVPGVAAWASYLLAAISPQERRQQIAQVMIIDADWKTRLLGLLATVGMEIDARQELLKSIAEKDVDPTVKAYAIATLERLKHPTTQSTTMPSTQPGLGIDAQIQDEGPVGLTRTPTTASGENDTESGLSEPQTQPME